ncbi:MAG: thiamine pyrophosphate-dependent dehydrogenase E1 component subunit alpha [Planctomycetota bacterium]|jgi:pyruvate dehydrogenase E1 component alpha subunit
MPVSNQYDRAFLAGLYESMYTIRVFETRGIRLYRQGLIRGYFHPYLGEEAIAVGVCAALGERDYISSTHRGHGHCIARGARLEKMVAELFGRRDGYCGGRGGSMHIADIGAGNLGANGVVGATIPIGVGAALGASIRGEDRTCVVFTSDGATCNGIFAEGLNLAAVWHLPLILVVENNRYAMATTIEEQTRETELYKRGLGYGVTGHRVDGNDVLEVYACARQAVEECRRGEGPVLIEALTFRHGGHHVNDPGKYMPQDKVAHYKARDPCKLGRRYLIEQGRASDEEVQRLEAQVEQRMEDAIEFAQNSPEPDVEAFLSEVGQA